MVILYSAFFPLNRIPDVNFVQTGFLFFFYGQELHILYICYGSAMFGATFILVKSIRVP